MASLRASGMPFGRSDAMACIGVCSSPGLGCRLGGRARYLTRSPTLTLEHHIRTPARRCVTLVARTQSTTVDATSCEIGLAGKVVEVVSWTWPCWQALRRCSQWFRSRPPTQPVSLVELCGLNKRPRRACKLHRGARSHGAPRQHWKRRLLQLPL